MFRKIPPPHMALSLHYIKQPHSCPLFSKPLGKSDLQALPVSYIPPAVSALEISRDVFLRQSDILCIVYMMIGVQMILADGKAPISCRSSGIRILLPNDFISSFSSTGYAARSSSDAFTGCPFSHRYMPSLSPHKPGLPHPVFPSGNYALRQIPGIHAARWRSVCFPQGQLLS